MVTDKTNLPCGITAKVCVDSWFLEYIQAARRVESEIRRGISYFSDKGW